MGAWFLPGAPLWRFPGRSTLFCLVHRIRFFGICALAGALASPTTADQKVPRDTGIVRAKPKTGMVETHWRNGRISSRYHLVEGELEGVYEQWWEDGIRMKKQKFKRGVLVDTAAFWNMDGHLSEISVFEDGNPISTRNWNNDGSKRFERIRIKDSTYRTIRWDSTGQVKADSLEIHPRVRWKFKAPDCDEKGRCSDWAY